MKKNISGELVDNAKGFLQKLSPELIFVIKIIDHSLPDERKRSLEKISDINFNWLSFLELIRKHHLTSFIAHKLDQYEYDFIPTVISQALKAQRCKNQIRSDQLCAELIKILNILKKNNIPAIPFKGPTLALQLYGDLTSRFSRDIDFLVQKHKMTKTLEILTNNGYLIQKTKQSPKKEQAYQDYNGQYLIFNEEGTIALEPHSMFGPSTLELNVDYQQLWQQQTIITFQGQSIPSFKLEDLFIILCIHGSKEKWARLKWIIDIAELLKKYPDLNWEYIINQSENWGCRRMVLVALSLSQRILKATLPTDIIVKLNNENYISYLTDYVEKNIKNTEPDRSTGFRISRFLFLIRERNRDKISYLFRTIFTPRELHYNLINLPDFMFFCYPLVKITHDYLLLPIWNLRKITFIK